MKAAYSFTDVETPGFDSVRNGLLTLASFVTDSSYGNVKEFFTGFRPEGKKDVVWSMDAQKVHGITWEEAMEFPPAKQACEEYLHFVSQFDPHTFVAHNAPFDWRMIRGMLSRYDLSIGLELLFPNREDTIKLLKESGLIQSKTKSLGAVCEELGIVHEHHNAKSDAFVLIEIHKRATGYKEQKQEETLESDGEMPLLSIQTAV